MLQGRRLVIGAQMRPVDCLGTVGNVMRVGGMRDVVLAAVRQSRVAAADGRGPMPVHHDAPSLLLPPAAEDIRAGEAQGKCAVM